MLAARQLQRIDDARHGRSAGLPETSELGVEEADVERGVVGDQRVVADELQNSSATAEKSGLSSRNAVGDAVHGLTASAGTSRSGLMKR